MHSSYKAAMTFDMIISSNVDLDTNKIIFPNCDVSEREWDYFDSFYEEYIAKLNLALVMAFVFTQPHMHVWNTEVYINEIYYSKRKLCQRNNSNWNS